MREAPISIDICKLTVMNRTHTCLTLLVLASVLPLSGRAEEHTAVPAVLAVRGKLLLDDNGAIPRGGPRTIPLGGNTTVRAWAGKWEHRPIDKAWRATWSPGLGHAPVVAYGVEAENLIVEVTFRYGVNQEPWHHQCFRITLDNRKRMTGHILSAWANPDNDFIETGFLLQHIHKRPDKTLIKDLLLDHQALNIQPQKWSTAVLEVVGDEALFRMGDHVAYSKFSELSGPKTKVALTLGTTWHEIRRVRIWNASARSAWGQDKDRILSARRKFSAGSHQYQAPPEQPECSQPATGVRETGSGWPGQRLQRP